MINTRTSHVPITAAATVNAIFLNILWINCARLCKVKYIYLYNLDLFYTTLMLNATNKLVAYSMLRHFLCAAREAAHTHTFFDLGDSTGAQ
jgi:ascorbate-specific PTS system EIIC-type component UlaA